MKQKKYVRYFLLALAGLALLFLAFVVIIYSIIFLEVRRVCNRAQSEYKTNCIDSLVKVLESDENTIKEKNDAIWVLGQFADPRGLQVLENLYTGKIPDREPLEKVISQYEIRKAIHWTEGGNWTSWMYFMYR